MIKWLKDLFAAKRQLAELQKAHDARLMLNRRLSQQNADLKSDDGYGGFGLEKATAPNSYKY